MSEWAPILREFGPWAVGCGILCWFIGYRMWPQMTKQSDQAHEHLERLTARLEERDKQAAEQTRILASLAASYEVLRQKQ